MDIPGNGKGPNTSLSFRYNANNEELVELFDECEESPLAKDLESGAVFENVSPKKGDKTSLLGKYYKTSEKCTEKNEGKGLDNKDEARSQSAPKEVTSSPMKEYLNRLGKRNNTSENSPDTKETNEAWKIFNDFKFKIAKAVEDMQTKSQEDTKEKCIKRENSTSDSEDNSAIKDSDISVGDTDNQVSSLESSLQNLSEMTQPNTAKMTEKEFSHPTNLSNTSQPSDGTHMNLVHSDSADISEDLVEDCIESGIEAVEDSNIPVSSKTVNQAKCTHVEKVIVPPPSIPTMSGSPPNDDHNIQEEVVASTGGNDIFTIPMFVLTMLLLFNIVLFPKANVWNGFVLGLWFFCLISNLKQWLKDKYFLRDDSKYDLITPSDKQIPYTIPCVKEHRPMKKYEGWVNEYRYMSYNPYNYRLKKTQSSYLKLEGSYLKISYTKTKIAKRALWSEKIENVTFYQHKLFNLSGAKVMLLPKGLVSKRHWSKKYPICVVLNDLEKVFVLRKLVNKDTTSEKINVNKQELETDTNSSPEKKHKFSWKRKDKSPTKGDNEAHKEGLRHRLARKLQRDKKTENASTSTENLASPNDDKNEDEGKTEYPIRVEIDDILSEEEVIKLKDFVEESEIDLTEVDVEWVLKTRCTNVVEEHLYLFGRTGREKLEWYRRLVGAIEHASGSTDSSSTAADDKTEEPVTENQDSIQATYKVSDKEVSFKKETAEAKSSEAPKETESPIKLKLLEPVSCEKKFWQFFTSIVHSTTPPELLCGCNIQTLEVNWLNTVFARIVYDVMRDPDIIARIQRKVQRKLHTIKLPPFMSPLQVTALSLAGACPRLERVFCATWDERGVWLDSDLRYEGGAYITILTQINLFKLKDKHADIPEFSDAVGFESTSSSYSDEYYLRKLKPAIYNSDEEDSAESSSDEEDLLRSAESNEAMTFPETPSSPSDAGGSSKKKFLRLVDKIATNKYFQTVTDYKYVKRAMEGLSNTDIKLQVNVRALVGRLVLNLPPPPHDRVWVGFRSNPNLVLEARPAVGARSVRFAHITNWIEQKLTTEFKKILVEPNMEDIHVNVMSPTPTEQMYSFD